MKSWLRLALLVGAGLVLIGVVYEAVRGSTAPVSRTDFTATDLNGRAWSLADHRGKRPVLLSFFATWCGPCHMERPHLIRLKEEFRDLGLEVVLITREPADVIHAVPEIAQAPLTILVGADEPSDAYRINNLPYTLLFDRAGEVVFDQEGYSEEMPEKIREKLRKMQASR